MKSATIIETASLRAIKEKVGWFNTPTEFTSGIAPYISCNTRKNLCVDIYSWERAIAGVSNDGPDWDPDEHYKKMLVIPFHCSRVTFRKAFGLARMCVRMPS